MSSKKDLFSLENTRTKADFILRELSRYNSTIEGETLLKVIIRAYSPVYGIEAEDREERRRWRDSNRERLMKEVNVLSEFYDEMIAPLFINRSRSVDEIE